MCRPVCVRFGTLKGERAGRMCDLRSLTMCWCLLAVRSVVKKVAQYMADVLEDSRDKVQENLLANGGIVAAFTVV